MEEMSIELESGNGSAEVLHPAKSTFDFPSVSVASELASVLSCGLLASLLMRRDQLCSAILQSFSKWITVGRLVID